MCVCIYVCENRKKLQEEEEARERLQNESSIVSFCVLCFSCEISN